MAGIPGLSFIQGTAPKGMTGASFGTTPSFNAQQALNSGGLQLLSGPKTAAPAPTKTPTQNVLSASTSPSTLAAPTQPSTYQDPYTGQVYASKGIYDAQVGQANTLYDQNAANLQNQLSGLDSQKQNAYNEIDTGLSGVQNDVNTSRQNSQTNTDQQIQDAGSIAQSTQQQNRNVLRALGIVNSTAAGELLTKPINEFGKQRAQLQQALGQRFGQLDDFLNQKQAEAQNAKNGILSQYTTLYNNIQNDLRFNDKQRLDAIQAINAAASQHLADIQTQMINYNNQVNLQKQSFANGLAQMGQYQDPSIPSNYLSSQGLALTAPQQQTQTTSVAGYDPKKQQGLSAFA